ncbi:ABC transporter substrate-binding protein [Tepidibacillus fermentans]|uniref:Putative ABC transport system substrate-binding protein n=1 Tax=Tepidibacillus fermentans TaxID=1281767 RepID=A0A4R3KL03_9BACI|nr:ABC transporter substrate-binding protein [Tepidibacillus fermentans]TCS84591.1 putative ABC transport system substrate-binding protein [Tepidibacillus fermentans]
MRRGLFIVISLIMVLSLFTGCVKETQPENSSVKDDSSNAVPLKIGITQIVEHPSLDSIREGILKGLADNGFEDGKNIIVDYRNAQGDRNVATTIAQKFVTDKVNMIIAITTPSAQAAFQATEQAKKNIPVVFSAVTDPVAAGLVKAFDQPGENITGTSDMVPIEKQIDLIKEMVPDVKAIGIVYNSGEVNAEVQLGAAKKAAEAKGIKIVEAGVTSTSEVSLGTASLIDKVDALFILNDNMIVSALDAVLKVAKEAKIPLFASDGDSVKRGAVATYGIDQFMIGVQTGEMAAKILKGESPKNIPVEGIKEVTLIVNEEAKKNFGLK